MPKIGEKKLTGFQAHKAKWEDCTLCPLHEHRTKVVLCRGQLPADICFVAESPGKSENLLGVPLIGPAGKLLDRIIANATNNNEAGWRMAFTNIVGCIPLDDGLKKTAEPDEAAIKACAPRLRELVELAKPQLMVMVGLLSQKWTPKATERIQVYDVSGNPVQWCSITHPAAVLKGKPERQGLMIQECEVTLAEAISNLVPF
jgi:uracil-DNA glycosylase family 4